MRSIAASSSPTTSQSAIGPGSRDGAAPFLHHLRDTGGGVMSATLTGEPGTARGGGRTAESALRRSANWARRAPLLPALIFTIIVTQLPFVVTLIISFMEWNAYYPDERGFAGVDNYVRVLTDVTTLEAIITTVELTVVVVLVSLILGLVIALLLDRKFRGRGVVRTMMITPFLIVPVAAALLWKHALYNPEYGLLNGPLTAIWGLFGAADSAPQPDWISMAPLVSVEVALIWQWTPFMMLL